MAIAIGDMFVRCELCDALEFDPRNELCRNCGNDMVQPDLWHIEMYAEQQAYKEGDGPPPDDEAEVALHWLAQLIHDNWA